MLGLASHKQLHSPLRKRTCPALRRKQEGNSERKVRSEVLSLETKPEATASRPTVYRGYNPREQKTGKRHERQVRGENAQKCLTKQARPLQFPEATAALNRASRGKK